MNIRDVRIGGAGSPKPPMSSRELEPARPMRLARMLRLYIAATEQDQKAIAAEIGVNVSTFSRWLAGSALPDAEGFIKIATWCCQRETKPLTAATDPARRGFTVWHEAPNPFLVGRADYMTSGVGGMFLGVWTRPGETVEWTWMNGQVVGYTVNKGKTP